MPRFAVEPHCRALGQEMAGLGGVGKLLGELVDCFDVGYLTSAEKPSPLAILLRA